MVMIILIIKIIIECDDDDDNDDELNFIKCSGCSGSATIRTLCFKPPGVSSNLPDTRIILGIFPEAVTL